MSYSRTERELRRWLEDLNESQKGLLLRAVQDGTLLKRAFWRHVESADPRTDLQIRELEKIGIKLEGLFEEIGPETLKMAKDYAEFYVERYEDYCRDMKIENPERFKYLVESGQCDSDGMLEAETKERQLRMGITLKAFEMVLQQLQIPYILNDPAVDWRSESQKELEDEPVTKFPFDFWIPLMGRVDVKSATLENPEVNIDLGDFERDDPHYVVACQILDMIEPRWLRFFGFMYRSEIRKEYKPVYLADRPFYSVPIEDFESKHDAKELIGILLIVRNIIKNILGPSD